MLRKRLPFLLLLVLSFSEARSAAPAPPAFEEAWRLAQTEFYDRTFRGLNWEQIGDQYRSQAAAASTPEGQSAVIKRMLAELGASHTGHFTPDEVAYFDLLDIFGGSLRRERERLFPGGKVAYEGIGAFTTEIAGKTFVTGILEGLPASRAGLLRGDEILDVDGAAYHAIKSFRGKAGQPVVMTIRRSMGAERETITLTPESIRPGEAYLNAMRASVRVIERNGARIGYVHVWSYAGHRYQELLEQELSTGELASADALIWDLRDGWGGAQLSYLDPFDRSGPTMTVIGRDGERDLVGFRWHKPVAMLVNEGTRSGKEILAYGMKSRAYGEVIGNRTAGAVLAGRAFILSDNSLLLLAVADVLIDGRRLEGEGVAPTIEVPMPLEYSGGQDPQLERAVELLARANRS
jgi:carboxyl-terminal processing protease